MFSARSMDFSRGTSARAFYALRHFYMPVCFFSEKPNRFSLDMNARPRRKIQIPATSTPEDGKLSFAHFCISFITSGRENAYGIVGRMPECPEAHRCIFFSFEPGASFRSSIFFDLTGLSTRALYNVCVCVCVVSGDRLIRAPTCYVTPHTC